MVEKFSSIQFAFQFRPHLAVHPVAMIMLRILFVNYNIVGMISIIILLGNSWFLGVIVS